MSPTLTKAVVEQLLREVESYLAAVDAFRAEGNEPVCQDLMVVNEEPSL